MKRVFEGWEARDFDALLGLTDPQIFAELALPPGDSTQSYRGQEEIRSFLRDGDETYEHFKAEPRAFAVGSTGRVFRRRFRELQDARRPRDDERRLLGLRGPRRQDRLVAIILRSASRSGGSRPRAACLNDPQTD